MAATPPLRWGLLATGWLTEEKMLPAIRRSKLGVPGGLVSRRPERAARVAERFGIPKVYASLDDMLADDAVDVIYNALPTSQHVPVTLKCVAAGKPVLCEKPIAMTAQEAKALLELDPNGPPVMEAFMIRHHPQWAYVRDLVTQGDLGQLRAIQTSFCYFNDDPASGTNRAPEGGGALLFVGCYAVMVGRLLFDAEPDKVMAHATVDPRFGTDTDMTAILDFGPARTLSFHVSTHSAWNQSVRVIGDKKFLTMQIPYNTFETEDVSIEINGSPGRDRTDVETVTFPAADHYANEADGFARAVLGEAPLPYSLVDAMANMRVIDALRKSSQETRWISLCPRPRGPAANRGCRAS